LEKYMHQNTKEEYFPIMDDEELLNWGVEK
jgi:hypothetical protein